MSVDALARGHRAADEALLSQKFGESKHLARLGLTGRGAAKHLSLPPISAASTQPDAEVLQHALAPFGIPDLATEIALALVLAADSKKRHNTHMPLGLTDIAALWFYGQFGIAEALHDATARATDVTSDWPYLPLLHLLAAALAKLPKVELLGVCFSTAAGIADEYALGATVHWWGLPSMARTLSAVDDRDLPAVFICDVRSAVDIAPFSRYSNDGEWVLAPGTRLRVAARTDTGDGLVCIRLCEE